MDKAQNDSERQAHHRRAGNAAQQRTVALYAEKAEAGQDKGAAAGPRGHSGGRRGEAER
ncbi:hypothetical protein PST29_2701 [Pseudomonas sp. St29]|nr:hypothetical protein PST29_2701 [Pseudomonas sp. St29]